MIGLMRLNNIVPFKPYTTEALHNILISIDMKSMECLYEAECFNFNDPDLQEVYDLHKLPYHGSTIIRVLRNDISVVTADKSLCELFVLVDFGGKRYKHIRRSLLINKILED